MEVAEKIIGEKLIFLDCALTGKNFKTALHTWENSGKIHPIDFITNDMIYYLSDGGYSRIYASCTDDTDPSTIKLCLDTVSSEKVKKAWKRCPELIQDIEETIRVALKIEINKGV